MDEHETAFVETFRRFLDELVHKHPPATITPLGEVVRRHLGRDDLDIPVVGEDIPRHRYVDVDIALSVIAGHDGTLVGVTGGQSRSHESFPGLLTQSHALFGPGPVDYTRVASGIDTQREVVGFGVRLFQFENRPVAVLQRDANPQFGRQSASIEVLSADAGLSGRVLAEVQRLMLEHSVLRGQVLSLEGDEYGQQGAGAVFLPRPAISDEEVILPTGVLDAVTRHVIGISQRATQLSEAGQHLKRGVLLYGPPGTGKTLTIRHLVGRAEGVTCILLTGTALRFIGQAADIARAMQPAIVVLEDVDLVGMERGMHAGPQPLLFALLDALDGLDGDADVAFLLTTNRVDTLEPALAQRPGRVDLAVEIPLPDAELRTRLFELYASGLPLSSEALTEAARGATGVTASFAKELMRRTVIRAAEEGRPPADDDLRAALSDLLTGSSTLTRRLLGGTDGAETANQ